LDKKTYIITKIPQKANIEIEKSKNEPSCIIIFISENEIISLVPKRTEIFERIVSVLKKLECKNYL
jgi:hypothetical protein